MKNRTKLLLNSEAQHSVEDVESLLNTLLLLDTFIVGFSINFMSILSYSDMLEADSRFFGLYSTLDLKINSYFGGTDGDGTHIVISATLTFRCWMTITFLSVSLFIAIGCIIGLNYSSCREDERSFHAWLKYFRFFIMLGYALFMVGFMYLNSSVGLLAYSHLPKYCGLELKGWGVFGKSSMFNVTTSSFTEGCPIENMDKWQGAAQITALNCLCPLVIIPLVTLSFFWGA